MTMNMALLYNLLVTLSAATASMNDQRHLRLRQIDFKRSILADAEGDYIHHPPLQIHSRSTPHPTEAYSAGNALRCIGTTPCPFTAVTTSSDAIIDSMPRHYDIIIDHHHRMNDGQWNITKRSYFYQPTRRSLSHQKQVTTSASQKLCSHVWDGILAVDMEEDR